MMSWIRATFRRAARAIGTRALKMGGLLPQDPASAGFWGYNDTGAGVIVSSQNALTYSAVWAAVRLLSESAASLPCYLYRRDANSRTVATEHPSFRVVAKRPNPEMTPLTFWQTVTSHALTWGNGYAEIERTTTGVPLALWPITPDKVRPIRAKDGELWYEVRNVSKEAKDYIPARDMFHLPGFGFDGLVGYSPIAMARESIGLGLAAQRFGSTFFGNSAVPGGVIQHPGTLSTTAQTNLRESIERTHQGPYRAHRLMILEEGAQWKQTTIPPEDSQFLETRKFEVTEVARWFNVPPHMIGDLERATFSNIEEMGIQFIIYSLSPWLMRIGQEADRKLLTDAEQETHEFLHATKRLEQARVESRYKAYATGRQWGWLSADDVRRDEGLNPLPDGQGAAYLTPVNMADSDKPENESDKADANPQA